MQNRANKKRTQKQKTSLSPRNYIMVGLVWVGSLILLLVQADGSTRVLNSAFFQIPLFYIGSLLVSYGIVWQTKDVARDTNENKWTRIFLFAAGVTVASLVVYSWLRLFVKGI